MTYDEIVDDVLNNLGNPDDDGEILSLVQDKVNFVITEDLHAKGLPFYESTATFSTVADQEYVAVPTGFVRANLVFIKKTSDVDYDSPLRIFEIAETRDMTTGQPEKHRVMYNATLAAPAIHFRPIPDAVYSGKIYYARKESALSGSSTAILSSIYGDMPIIAGATYWSAFQLRRLDTAAIWKGEYQEAVAAMCEWLRERHGLPYEEPGLYGQQDELTYEDRYND
jgi:hypothetical protein